MLSTIDRLEAHRQITQLMYRYSECVDHADFAGMEELFQRGILHVNGDVGEHITGDEVTPWFERNLKVHGDSLATRHCISNAMIDIADNGGRPPHAPISSSSRSSKPFRSSRSRKAATSTSSLRRMGRGTSEIESSPSMALETCQSTFSEERSPERGDARGSQPSPA